MGQAIIVVAAWVLLGLIAVLVRRTSIYLARPDESGFCHFEWPWWVVTLGGLVALLLFVLVLLAEAWEEPQRAAGEDDQTGS